MARVTALLDDWATRLGLREQERERWRAAGQLHDALRNGDPERLRSLVGELRPRVSDSIVHGPAVARKLRAEGVADEDFLLALSHHSLGHPGFGPLGRFLYMADFLEPGRPQDTDWRRDLRARLPGEADAVLPEVVRARLSERLERGRPLHPLTVAFWNGLVEPVDA
jgi:HD superfamily phosphohydrolase YqeK